MFHHHNRLLTTIIYVVIILAALWTIDTSSISPTLSSFKPDKLQIHLTRQQIKQWNVIEQTLFLIQNHFIHKHMYNSSDWMRWRQEMYAQNDTSKAIKRFIRGLNEPYTHYLEPSRMIDRYERISGVRDVGVGMRISRQLCLSPAYLRYVYSYARRTILLSYRWNVFNTIASSAITLFYKANNNNNNNSSSDSDTIGTSSTTSSRVIYTNDPFNYKHDNHRSINQDHRLQLMRRRLRQVAVRLFSLLLQLLQLHHPPHIPDPASVAGQSLSHPHAHRYNHTLLRDRGYYEPHLSKPQLLASMSLHSMLLLLRNSIILSCIITVAVMIVAECSIALWTRCSSIHHLHHSHWTHHHWHRLMGFSSTPSSSLSSLSYSSSSLSSLSYSLCFLVALPLLDFLYRLYPYIFPIMIQDDDHDDGVVVASTPRGLRSNDHIIAIDDEMVLGRHRSIHEINRMLDDGEVGDVVHVSILRLARGHEKGDDHNDSDIGSSSSRNSKSNNDTANYHHHHHHQHSDYQHPVSSNSSIGASSYSNRWYRSLLSSLSSHPIPLLTQTIIIERTYGVVRGYLPISPLIQRVMPSRQGSYLGYVGIKEFSDETFHHFSYAVEQLNASILKLQGQAMKGLIIDLRGNPGGPLVSALEVASLFLPNQAILTQLSIDNKDNDNDRGDNERGDDCRTRHRRVERFYSTNRRPDITTKLLLLCDEYTASASEILMEALCDNKRAVSMGTKTVGKNKAQAVISLSDGSGLCFTVREFFTPSQRSMKCGHIPSIAVPNMLQLSTIRFHHDHGRNDDTDDHGGDRGTNNYLNSHNASFRYRRRGRGGSSSSSEGDSREQYKRADDAVGAWSIAS